MKDKKPKRRGLVDMDFDEGLARLIQTKPGEVKPPAGKKRKKSKRSPLPILLGEKNEGDQT